MERRSINSGDVVIFALFVCIMVLLVVGTVNFAQCKKPTQSNSARSNTSRSRTGTQQLSAPVPGDKRENTFFRGAGTYVEHRGRVMTVEHIQNSWSGNLTIVRMEDGHELILKWDVAVPLGKVRIRGWQLESSGHIADATAEQI